MGFEVFLARAWLSDWAIAGYCLIVAVLCAVRAPAVRHGWLYALAHLAVLGIVFLLVRFDRPGIPGFLRCWDAVVLVPALFLMAMQIVHQVNPADCDAALIRMDEAIGGLGLLRGMASIEYPWLTAAMKLAWIGYYLLPLLAGIPLYGMGRVEFAGVKSALVLGWMASYLCYFAWPAVGPGYFEQSIQVPQPQWDSTPVSQGAKGLIEALESEDPRHTFPSGHAAIAALVAFYLIRHRRWTWAAAGVPLAAAVVFSTIYLRYHYVTDVIAGLALALACAAAELLTARRAQAADRTSPE